MLTFLIVDDEPRHRTGLVNMVGKCRPAYKIFSARNGKEALNFLASNRVDVIVTDIKMPMMDGLQLIEELGDRINEVRVIILSAYGYFEYAQKAISLGAFDYILKPVDEASIVKMLEKVENAIRNENLKKQEKEAMKKKLDNTLPAYLENQLNKWVKGGLSREELSEVEGIIPYKGYGIVILSEICNFSEVTEVCSWEEINEMKLNIKYWLKEALDSVGHSISFLLQGDRTIFVTIVTTAGDFDFLNPSNQDRLHGIIKDLKLGYDLDAVIGVGEWSSSIFGDIRKAFETAMLALSFKFFLKDSKVINYPLLTYNSQKQILIVNKKEEELTELVRQGEKEKAVQALDGIISGIASNGYPRPEKFIDAFVHMLLNVAKAMQYVVCEEKIEQFITDISRQLTACESFEEFSRKMRGFLTDIIELLAEYKNNKNELVLGRCLDYIEKNYMNELSLESIAEVFHFNPSYFSSLFKNKTGINFCQYLLELRLKKGKELLEKTDYKIYEVAKRVGYRDSKYFNRVFKKEFGVAPDEFRRL